MDTKLLAELLFPNVTKTPEDMEALFPARELPEGAVKRFERYSPDFYLYLSDHSPIIADIEL